MKITQLNKLSFLPHGKYSLDIKQQFQFLLKVVNLNNKKADV